MTHSRRRRGQGQALVEFALVVPVLMMMIFAIIDFGRVFMTYAMASNAVRDALRRAEIIGYIKPEDGGTPPYADCAQMRAIAARIFFVDTSDITISYYRYEVNPVTRVSEPELPFPRVCTTASIDPDELENGDILNITINRQIRLMTPLISSLIPALPVRFSGQRTIIKDIPLFAITDPDDPNRDTDYDGLRDEWEHEQFADDPDDPAVPSDLYQNATDDPDNDDCNNGCEEARGSDPNVADTDGDGLTDGEEAYTYVTDPTKTDTDDDGLDDPTEVGLGTNPRTDDTDSDCLTDGDEVLVYETSPFTDDSDTDGGGPEVTLTCNGTPLLVSQLSDYIELHTYLTDPNLADTDSDGLTDEQEIFQAFTSFTTPNNADTDGDGLNDGVEVLGWDRDINNVTVHFTSNPKGTDTDGDGLTDVLEHDGWTSNVNGVANQFYANPNVGDADADGVDDEEEYAHGTDPNNADTDGDSLSDRAEIDDPEHHQPLIADNTDDDLDGLPDTWEQTYFPTTWNDADHIATSDPDGDGCNNQCEFQYNLDPSDSDTDNDNLNDGAERSLGSNGRVPDTDGDGILDGEEAVAGADGYVTSPTQTDTDGDTLTDSQEITGWSGSFSSSGTTQSVHYDSNPTQANSDGDSFDDKNEFNRGTNPKNSDTDGDGLNDDTEVNNGTNATDPRDDDTDDDGMKDGVEINSGCMNPNARDTDGDTWPDLIEYNTSGRNPCTVEPSKIAINDVIVSETAGTVVFTVTMTEPNGAAVTVNYTTANGTAVSATDYTATTASVILSAISWPATTSTQTISIPLTDDLTDELNEVFYVNLTSAPGATITDNQGMVTIQDNDGPPSVSINDPSGLENQPTASPSLTFTASLSRASGKAITVNYSTANNTATSGSDYTAVASGSVTFAAGEITKSVTISLNNDGSVESSETFYVNLTIPAASAADVTAGDMQGIGTILDDDGVYLAKIAATSPAGVSENIGTHQMNFTVSLDRPANGSTINVTATTSNGSAKSGSDYTSLSQVVSFASGEQSKQFIVTITDDNYDDNFDNETVFVTLSNPTSNVQLVSGQTTATGLILDNETTPTVSIGNAGIIKPNQNTSSGTITVTLSGPSENTITVNYTTAGGRSPQQTPNSNAATSPTNYTLNTTSPLTFAAQSTTKTITITVTNASKNTTQYFYFTLTSATNATRNDFYGDVTLCDKNSATCPAPTG